MTTQKNATGNPFFDFDVTKVFADFDPAKYAGEFAKFADRYNVPGFHVTAVLEAQRRNVEALIAAILPSLLIGALLFVLGSAITGIALIGVIAGAGGLTLALSNLGLLLVGALIGGLIAE